jgi:putative multiple sugar transport system permease protein
MQPCEDEKMTFLQELTQNLKRNIREYGMYIALFVIFLFFSVATDGMFISSRNISNLFNQMGYIAVLAIGMTLVIVIRHIDLSVGFLAGFLGAVAAIALTQWNLPVWAVIPLVLVFGIGAGLITALMVAKFGIPAFVATLAGWLIYRGALLQVTLRTGTIIIPNPAFNAIGNGYIPDLPLPNFLPGLHKVTLLIGLLAAILMVISSISSRRKKIEYDFEVSSKNMFIISLIFMVILIGIITYILAGYNGLSWTAVIVLGVTLIYHFLTTQTFLGRHIYAVGGNPEAAELSGISVSKITYIVFGSMGMLSALSGMLYASRLQSATTTAGTLFELDAIAAAYVGGVSSAGGVGKVTGSLIGAIVMISLTNGMNLMGIDISTQYIVRGAVLVAAVVFDVATRKRGI